ncbi:glycerophosphodiester phosphodiesterase [Streptomyces sp. NPDC007983]|uniref:glycerophosphodiester phosphodiesterase n=1 Tax=Streptomyces sp. NPDC007983 TaxID=3364800 RepID=UPI0036EB7BD3
MITRYFLTGVAVLTLSIPAAVLAYPTARPAVSPAARPPEPRLDDRSAALPAAPRIIYTAHRGGALEVPENSMAGLTTALARKDAQVLDFDIRSLRDGTLVVMHDATLDRTTSRTGPVNALTAAQWRTVRLRPAPTLRGAWKPERPPTVAEALDRLGGRTTLMVEAKDPAGLPRLARMIRDRGLTRSVYVNSNHPDVAREAHRMGLLAQLWRSARQMRHDRPSDWRGFVDLLDVDYRARDADIRRAVASGVPHVWAHTVNTPRQRDRMVRLGCDGIITDTPSLMITTPVRLRAGGGPGGDLSGG